MRTQSISTENSNEFEKRLNYNYKLIYKVGCATGLRITDIVTLKKDILLKDRPTIKEKKTGKSKKIYIPVKLRKELIEFSKYNKEYIFQGRSKKGHITRQAVHKHFKKIANELKINENVGTHTMRKNFAIRMLKKDKGLTYVKNKLNHSHLADTLLYIINERM